MRLKNWKNLFFYTLLTSSGGSWFCIGVDAAKSANTDIWHPNNLLSTQVTYQPCQKLGQEAINSLDISEKDLETLNSRADLTPLPPFPTREWGIKASLRFGERFGEGSCINFRRCLLCKQSSKSSSLDFQMPLNMAQQTSETTQAPKQTEEANTEKQNDPPPLESQPSDLLTSPPDSKEQLLNPPQLNQSQRLERLIQLLRSPKQPSESNSERELGLRVRLRPLEQQPPPETEKPVVKFKPIGYLQAHVGYFQTNNIFSSNDNPTEDGLIISGLTLASAYFPLGSKTYLNGSLDGNLIRYLNQSQYHYNQVKFNLSIYQQLSRQMYGEISFSNQQLFYANNSDRQDSFKAGDRFLNENSLQLSLGRHDPLTPKLTLDSFYELSVSFANPLSRNRIINSFWLSLNYYLQKPLQIGIDYQGNFSDFTQRDREDQFHRLFGHLNYRISDTTNMNVQAGVSLGSSTAENIDFDGWFFTVNYNLQLGRF